ncbi:DUF6458 family protein [Pedococcus cremeus]|nr:DUF6458 family protein [Pedococcus cremeus]
MDQPSDEEGAVMGAGVLMAVLGAILTFAVRVDAPGVDLQVVGVILMVAGGAVIAYARRTVEREHVVTQVETPTDPAAPQHSVRQVVRDTERD